MDSSSSVDEREMRRYLNEEIHPPCEDSTIRLERSIGNLSIQPREKHTVHFSSGKKEDGKKAEEKKEKSTSEPNVSLSSTERLPPADSLTQSAPNVSMPPSDKSDKQEVGESSSRGLKRKGGGGVFDMANDIVRPNKRRGLLTDLQRTSMREQEDIYRRAQVALAQQQRDGHRRAPQIQRSERQPWAPQEPMDPNYIDETFWDNVPAMGRRRPEEDFIYLPEESKLYAYRSHELSKDADETRLNALLAQNPEAETATRVILGDEEKHYSNLTQQQTAFHMHTEKTRRNRARASTYLSPFIDYPAIEKDGPVPVGNPNPNALHEDLSLMSNPPGRNIRWDQGGLPWESDYIMWNQKAYFATGRRGPTPEYSRLGFSMIPRVSPVLQVSQERFSIMDRDNEFLGHAEDRVKLWLHQLPNGINRLKENEKDSWGEHEYFPESSETYVDIDRRTHTFRKILADIRILPQQYTLEIRVSIISVIHRFFAKRPNTDNHFFAIVCIAAIILILKAIPKEHNVAQIFEVFCNNDITKQEVLTHEVYVANTIDWRFDTPMPTQFLDMYFMQIPEGFLIHGSLEVYYCCEYFIELLITEPALLAFSPSMVAAAAIRTVIHYYYLGNELAHAAEFKAWSDAQNADSPDVTLNSITGHPFYTLDICHNNMAQAFQHECMNIFNNRHQYIRLLTQHRMNEEWFKNLIMPLYLYMQREKQKQQ